MRCDLVVVGAGPAGSMAAKTAAAAGLDVVMLEKRQEIGDPVRCAEGVSKEALKKLVELDPRWIAAEVKGARIHAPDGTCITMSEDRAGGEVGYVLERKVFDRHLAMEASRAGVRVMVKTRALGLLRRDGVPCGVSALFLGDHLEIEAPLVVGADGVESKVGRWAGINTTLKPGDIEVCAQHLVHDNGINDDYCEFYLGNKIAPGGYVWEFPKGKKLANVGLGVLGSRSEPGLPMRCLKEFLRIRMPEAKILEIMVGGVPVSGPIETAIADGVMLVGDAARQSDPLTGGGIVNGMRAGVMAGEVAADAISRGDTSRSGLLAYEEMWRETIGKHISRNYNLKEFFVNLTDEDLNGLVRSLKDVDTSNMDLKGVVRLASKLNPHLLWKMRKLV